MWGLARPWWQRWRRLGTSATAILSRIAENKINTIENHPPVIHLDTKETDDVVDLVKRISGNSKLNTVAYGAEAGQFAAEGFQSAICGPGSIEQAHRANEFIAKDELVKGMDMMKKLISEMSSQNFK